MKKVVAGFTCYIVRQKRSNMRITVGRGGKISVYVPKRTPAASVTEFINKHLDFIKRNVDRSIQTHDAGLFGEKSASPILSYLGADYPVIFSVDCKNGAYFDRDRFVFPTGLDTTGCREQIIAVYRRLALDYIPKRVKELSSLHGLEYSKISINKAVTRWGSCNTKRNLNFSLFLIAAPAHCIDYVIRHELSHTVHMNHSPRFYALLSSLEPNYLSIKSELSVNYGSYAKKF